MTFNFYMPTRVISGENCIQNNGGLLAGLGKKAFMMTGKSSAEKNGSLSDITKTLSDEGIKWVHYNQVKPNPSLEDVRIASEEAKAAGVDFIIAIGGGSPMDAAKAVAVLAGSDISDEELLSRKTFPCVLPLVAVPTTSGTGSEVTPYSILTNKKLETKSFLVSEQIYPAVSFLDGRYTADLPREITINTTIDALSHAAEGYLSVRSIVPGRALALEALKLIGSILPEIAAGKLPTPEQRDQLLYASMLAGIVISQSGTTAVHAMGYSLTYFKGIDHGLANGYLMAEYFRFIAGERSEEIDILLSALGQDSIDSFDELLKTLLGTTGLTREEIDRFASIASKAGNILNTNPQPDESDLKRILSNCFASEE